MSTGSRPVMVGGTSRLRGPSARWDDRHRPAGGSAAASSTVAGGSDQVVLAAGLGLSAAILLGMSLQIPALTALASFTAALVAVAAPAIGLVVVVFMSPLNAPTTFGVFAFSLVIVGAVALGCLCRLPIDRIRVRLTAPALLLVGYVAFLCIPELADLGATIGTSSSPFAAYLIQQLLSGAGLILSAAYIFHLRRPHPFLVAGMCGAVVAAALALMVRDSVLIPDYLAGLIAQSEGLARAVGPFSNPNYFGLFAAVAVVTMVGWGLWVSTGFARLVTVLAAVVVSLALAASLSRAAVIALVVGLVMLAAARRLWLGVAAAAAAILAIVFAYPLFLEWRLTQTFGAASSAAYIASEGSDAGRLNAMLAGFDLFASSPVVGIGLGNYALRSPLYLGDVAITFSHNWYVNVLAEGGIVGSLLFAGLLVSVLSAFRRISTPIRRTAFGAACALLAGGFFTEPASTFQASALALLVIVAGLAARKVDGAGETGGQLAT